MDVINTSTISSQTNVVSETDYKARKNTDSLCFTYLSNTYCKDDDGNITCTSCDTSRHIDAVYIVVLFLLAGILIAIAIKLGHKMIQSSNNISDQEQTETNQGDSDVKKQKTLALTEGELEKYPITTCIKILEAIGRKKDVPGNIRCEYRESEKSYAGVQIVIDDGVKSKNEDVKAGADADMDKIKIKDAQIDTGQKLNATALSDRIANTLSFASVYEILHREYQPEMKQQAEQQQKVEKCHKFVELNSTDCSAEVKKRDNVMGVNEIDCLICFEKIESNDFVREIPCNHIYHRECLDIWLLTRVGICPTCRFNLKPCSLKC